MQRVHVTSGIAVMTMGLLGVLAILLYRGNLRRGSHTTHDHLDKSQARSVVGPNEKISADDISEILAAISGRDLHGLSRLLEMRVPSLQEDSKKAILRALLKEGLVDSTSAQSLLSAFSPATILSVVLEESSHIQVDLVTKSDLLQKVNALAECLRQAKNKDTSLDLGSTLLVEANRAPAGQRVLLALLALHVTVDGWYPVLLSALESIESRTTARLLFDEVFRIYGKLAAGAMLAVYLDPQFADLRRPLGEAIITQLPSDEGLALVLHAAASTGNPTPALEASDLVARILKSEPNSMQLITEAWKQGPSMARLAIVVGLGSDRSRVDVSEFLIKIAEDDTEPSGLVRGTALTSLSRQGLRGDYVVEAASRVLGLEWSGNKEDTEYMLYKSNAVSALSNLWKGGTYRPQIESVIKTTICDVKEDPRVIIRCLEFIQSNGLVAHFSSTLGVIGTSHLNKDVATKANELLSSGR